MKRTCLLLFGWLVVSEIAYRLFVRQYLREVIGATR